MVEPYDQPYDVADYLKLSGRLRAGERLQEADRAYLEARVQPGALLSYQGELLEVSEGFVGEYQAVAQTYLKRRARGAEDARCGVELLTLGLVLTRLVAGAPVVPATLPELAV